jgi:hypothetical protein
MLSNKEIETIANKIVDAMTVRIRAMRESPAKSTVKIGNMATAIVTKGKSSKPNPKRNAMICKMYKTKSAAAIAKELGLCKSSIYHIVGKARA